jgi:hypothetical protein
VTGPFSLAERLHPVAVGRLRKAFGKRTRRGRKCHRAVRLVVLGTRGRGSEWGEPGRHVWQVALALCPPGSRGKAASDTAVARYRPAANIEGSSREGIRENTYRESKTTELTQLGQVAGALTGRLSY